MKRVGSMLSAGLLILAFAAVLAPTAAADQCDFVGVAGVTTLSGGCAITTFACINDGGEVYAGFGNWVGSVQITATCGNSTCTVSVSNFQVLGNSACTGNTKTSGGSLGTCVMQGLGVGTGYCGYS